MKRLFSAIMIYCYALGVIYPSSYYDTDIVTPPKAIKYFSGDMKIFSDINQSTTTFELNGGRIERCPYANINELWVNGTQITGTGSGSNDNLGNHVATTTLIMGGFGITGAGNIDATSITSTCTYSSNSGQLQGHTAAYFATAAGLSSYTPLTLTTNEISSLSTTYLGISGTAADSNKLGGHTSSYYVISNELSALATTYLGITAKAADADTLDTHDTAYFATAGHTHAGVYEPAVTEGSLPNSSILSTDIKDGEIALADLSVATSQYFNLWDNLDNVPAGFADGVDDVGEPGSGDNFGNHVATTNIVMGGFVISGMNTLALGADHTTVGALTLYGDNANACPYLKFYNSVNQDDTDDYWTMKSSGTMFSLGNEDSETFKFYSAGNLTALGNIAGATYASDASVSDTELKYINTLASNAQTQISGKQATVTEGSLTDSVIVSADIKDATIATADLSAGCSGYLTNWVNLSNVPSVLSDIQGDSVAVWIDAGSTADRDFEQTDTSTTFRNTIFSNSSINTTQGSGAIFLTGANAYMAWDDGGFPQISENSADANAIGLNVMFNTGGNYTTTLVLSDNDGYLKDFGYFAGITNPTLAILSANEGSYGKLFVDTDSRFNIASSSNSIWLNAQSGANEVEITPSSMTVNVPLVVSSFTVLNQYTLPTTAGTDNQILKFNGENLGWEADATAAGGGDDLGNHVATTTLVMGGNVISGMNTLGLGTDNTTAGALTIYGDNAKESGRIKLFNSADYDDTEEYWMLKSSDTMFTLGAEDVETFKFYSAGNFSAAGNIAGTTYGSDASVSNAELLYINTLASNAQTQINGKQATVTEGSLADSVIVSADIKDGTIVAADMTAATTGWFTNWANISNKAVVTGEITDGTIGTADLSAACSNYLTNYNNLSNKPLIDYVVVISSPLAEALGVGYPVSKIYGSAITISSVTFRTQGGTNCVGMLEQRALHAEGSAGTDVFSGDITITSEWRGGTFADSSMPANYALYYVPTSVSGDPNYLQIRIQGY